jgi:transglutaminase-like putative cysteine protease
MQARQVTILLNNSLALTTATAVLMAPIPPVYAFILLVAVPIGIVWDLKGSHPLSRNLLTAVGAAGFLVSLLPASRESLAEHALGALAVLFAVKLLERKIRRDHFQILTLAATITVGAGSLSPDLVFGVLIFLICFLGTFTLVWIPFSDLRNLPQRAGLLFRLTKLAFGLTVLSVPLAVVIFVVFPRTGSAFWGGLAPPQRRVSGFSDKISLGEVGKIAVSREVAFRAEMTDPPGPLAVMPYWRGIIMEETDGRQWTTVPGLAIGMGYATPPYVRVTYYVEPHGERQLFVLEQPEAAFVGLRPQYFHRGRTVLMRGPLTKRIRYQGLSKPGAVRSRQITSQVLEQNLQLPDDFSPRIRELAQEVAAGAKSPGETAERFLAFFRRDFTYSLENPPAVGDPLEDFLFRRRSGYCEYYASALAVMLRATGIPARVVAGYLGGRYNENGNYYIVTQAAAHTWVEAHFGKGGWSRLDATPAAEEGYGGTFASRSLPPTRLWIDSLRMKWNSLIIQYDRQAQVDIIRRTSRVRLKPARPSLPGAGLFLLAVILPFALWYGWRRRTDSLDPVTHRYRRFNALMSRKGIERALHEGPLDFSGRIAAAWPEAAGPAGAFARLYAALHYGGVSPTPGRVAKLDSHLETLTGIKRGSGPDV